MNELDSKTPGGKQEVERLMVKEWNERVKKRQRGIYKEETDTDWGRDRPHFLPVELMGSGKQGTGSRQRHHIALLEASSWDKQALQTHWEIPRAGQTHPPGLQVLRRSSELGRGVVSTPSPSPPVVPQTPAPLNCSQEPAGPQDLPGQGPFTWQLFSLWGLGPARWVEPEQRGTGLPCYQIHMEVSPALALGWG